MRPLRIAFVVSSLVLAGGERQQVALAERLPKDRFRIDFIARAGEGPLDERARAAGSRVISIGTYTPEGASLVRRTRAIVGRTEGLILAIGRGRYDIVDSWLYPSDLFAAAARIVTRTPVVLSGRIDVLPRGRSDAVSKGMNWFAHRQFDAVTAICDAVAENAVRAQGADPTRIRVIRNGVEMIPPLSSDERARRRDELGAGEDDFLIGCVGNYREMKGHVLLVEAFAKVLEREPTARLVLVGEGPTRGEIERAVRGLGLEDRVRLHGAVMDVSPYYGAFDLVVQASRSEGLPNVLVEAAAAGRPMVATAAGGTREIVIDGETGILVPIEDRAALTQGMLRAAQDPDLRLRLGQGARSHAESAYGMDRFVREWGDFYEEMAARKGIARGTAATSAGRSP
ncbi:MAG: glycosyltransferase [Chloroflexota bacterium]